MPRTLFVSILLTVVAFVPVRSRAADPLGVKVLPNRTAVLPGASTDFTVEVRAGEEAVLDGAVSWSVRPASIGSISSNGHFIASRESGEGLVRAEVRRGDARGVGYAFVRVGGGSAARTGFQVAVTPARTRVAPGGSAQFAVTASGTDGPLAPEWRVVPESFGRIDASGHFTAGDHTGECRVVAVVRSGAGVGFGQAQVLVVPATGGRGVDRARRLVLVPSRLVTRAGETQAFTVDSSTFEGRLPGPVAWTVEPAQLGTMSAQGLFTAGAESGAGVVRATLKTADGATLTGVAPIRIGNGSGIAGLRIVPQRLFLRSGDTQQLGVAARREALRVEWRVIPENIGRVTPDGLLTAGDPGAGQVIAEIRDERGALLTTSSTSLHVFAEAVPAFSIETSASTLRVGEAATLSVRLSAASLPLDASVRWEIVPRDLGEFLPPTGATTQFRALRPGTGTVTAYLRVGDRRVAQASTGLIVQAP